MPKRAPRTTEPASPSNGTAAHAGTNVGNSTHAAPNVPLVTHAAPLGTCPRCTGKLGRGGSCLRCNPIKVRGMKYGLSKKTRESIDPRIRVELDAAYRVKTAIAGLKKDAASRVFTYVLGLIAE